MTIKKTQLIMFFSLLATMQSARPMLFAFEEEGAFDHTLQEAIQIKDTESVYSLLYSLDRSVLNVHDTQDRTLLGYAIAAGNSEIVRALLTAGANPNMETKGRTPLMLAVQLDKCDLIQLLCDYRATDPEPYELYYHAINNKSEKW